MSTRSNFGIVTSKLEVTDTTIEGSPTRTRITVETVYHHSDGYPQGLGATLHGLLKDIDDAVTTNAEPESLSDSLYQALLADNNLTKAQARKLAMRWFIERSPGGYSFIISGSPFLVDAWQKDGEQRFFKNFYGNSARYLSYAARGETGGRASVSEFWVDDATLTYQVKGYQLSDDFDTSKDGALGDSWIEYLYAYDPATDALYALDTQSRRYILIPVNMDYDFGVLFQDQEDEDED